MGHMGKKMAKKMRSLKDMAKKMGKSPPEPMMAMMDMVAEVMMMKEGKGGDYDMMKGGKKHKKVPDEVKALMKVAMDILKESNSSEEDDDSSEEEDDDYSMEECSPDIMPPMPN